MSDVKLFRDGITEDSEKIIKEESWKLGFQKRLLSARDRFKGEGLGSQGLMHSAALKRLTCEDADFATEVGKLSLIAVQLLAVSSTEKQLRSDLPFFRAKYVNIFASRDELNGVQPRDDIEKKLRSGSGQGGQFHKIYDRIKSGTQHTRADEPLEEILCPSCRQILDRPSATSGHVAVEERGCRDAILPNTSTGAPGILGTSDDPLGYSIPQQVAVRLPNPQGSAGEPPQKKTRLEGYGQDTEASDGTSPSTDALSVATATCRFPEPRDISLAASTSTSTNSSPYEQTQQQLVLQCATSPRRAMDFLCHSSASVYQGSLLAPLLRQLNLGFINFVLNGDHYVGGPFGAMELCVIIRHGWKDFPTNIPISFSMQASDFIESVEGVIVTTVSTHHGFVTIVPEHFEIYWAVADADWKTILFSKANSAQRLSKISIYSLVVRRLATFSRSA
ncbi:hypothetical protein B0H63DRAFT_221871 [Podospora didyma]|uniref:Uncharacterized protein n=1 Tax=Podospora didyma TaxID=330526 RepID=A0AAE0KJ01_9PEZI|nr:hypothetical protein B0H63DRAFT_221871 [Podospora didyma]